MSLPATNTPWVTLTGEPGKKRLLVHGRPFISLGIQIDFRHCTSIGDYDYLFEHIIRMGLNTVFFPIRWFTFEPQEGRYDFTIIDHALRRCTEHSLYMSLLWFGTNQGGGLNPAPAWFRDDTTRFRRVRDAAGNGHIKLCPLSKEGLAVEKKSMETLLRHIAETDRDRRVIFMQVENEPCLEMKSQPRRPGELIDSWSFRCHCPVCNEAFANSCLDEWDFSATSLAGYFRDLLQDQKSIHPLLTYTNFLLNPQRPGEDLDIWLATAPQLDLIGIDYYGFCSADLDFAMRFFNRGRNALFVAEHSTESVGDAAANVFRAICGHGAIAFDPWAIDYAFGWRAWRDHIKERSFVEKDGTWSDAAIAYGKSCRALGAAAELIATHIGTGNLLWYATENALPRSLEERRWGITWRWMSGPQGRWALIKISDTQFVLAGVGLQVVVKPGDDTKTCTMECGAWKSGEWHRTAEAPIIKKFENTALLELEDGACILITVS